MKGHVIMSGHEVMKGDPAVSLKMAEGLHQNVWAVGARRRGNDAQKFHSFRTNCIASNQPLEDHLCKFTQISGILPAAAPAALFESVLLPFSGQGPICSLMSWTHLPRRLQLLSLLPLRCSSCTKCSHDTPARNVATHMTHVIWPPSRVTCKSRDVIWFT
jgi:hypothetical protein